MTAAEAMLLDAPAALAPDDLRRTCDPRQLGFATTSEVEPLDRVVGQPRAVEALDLALGLELPGYHVFVTGPPGTGRRAAAEAHLRRRALTRPEPPDRVYVFNFSKPRRPLAITLPAGRGPDFAGDVEQLVGEARRRLHEAFESEHYRERHQRLHDRLDVERHQILEELQARARTQQVALELTPAGVVMLPLVDGRAVSPQEMEQLPAERLEAHRDAVRGLEEVVGSAFSRLRWSSTRRLAPIARWTARSRASRSDILSRTRPSAGRSRPPRTGCGGLPTTCSDTCARWSATGRAATPRSPRRGRRRGPTRS